MMMAIVVPENVEALEEMLIECHRLWWRSPRAGLGGSPFAGDGPWHLALREVGDIKGFYSQTLLKTESGQELLVRKVDGVRPRGALDAGEVDLRDRISEWFALIPEPGDRRMIWLATLMLAREEGGVSWTGIAQSIGYGNTARALAYRYRREMARLVCRLQGWPERRRHELAAMTVNPRADEDLWR